MVTVQPPTDERTIFFRLRLEREQREQATDHANATFFVHAVFVVLSPSLSTLFTPHSFTHIQFAHHNLAQLTTPRSTFISQLHRHDSPYPYYHQANIRTNMSFRLPKFPMVTIFHNPSLKTSTEALSLLQKASRRYNFEIDLIQTKTQPPTHQQVANIVEYLGNGSIDEGLKQILVTEVERKPSTVAEVQEILDRNPGYLRKPLLVDWNRGKALIAGVSFVG